MLIQQESLLGQLMTVRGPIEVEAMGITLPHEHLLLYHTPDDIVLSDSGLGIEELMVYAQAGGERH